MVFNASFWEAGLVSNTIPSQPPAGLAWARRSPAPTSSTSIDAGSGGAPANEMDMDSSGYLAYTKLFPNIETRPPPRLAAAGQAEPDAGGCPSRSCLDTGPYISATAAIQGDPAATSEPVFGAPPAGTDDLGALFDPGGRRLVPGLLPQAHLPDVRAVPGDRRRQPADLRVPARC